MSRTSLDSVADAELSASGPKPSTLIRACMLSFYFHPNYSGSSIQAFNLSQKLRSHGVDPFIVSANLSNGPAHEVIDGISLYRLPVARADDWQIPSFSVAAARFLFSKRKGFDLIHAHGTVQHGVASMVGRLLGKPTILKVAMMGSDLGFEGQGRVTGRLNKLLVSRFDQYIATTAGIASEFADRGLDAKKVALIPNGVDTGVFAPVSPENKRAIRRDLGLPEGPIVACVAIINERKNIDGALRIWREIVKKGLAGHLIFVGPVHVPGGPFERQLQAFIRDNGLAERVSLLGRRDRVDLYLQASDVFLFPSRQEGMPNGVLEAMSTGLPCLVSQSSGLERIIQHGVNGFAMEISNEGQFVDVLGRVLQNDSLRQALGGNARDTIERLFSLDTVAKRYRALYDQLLCRSSPSAG